MHEDAADRASSHDFGRDILPKLVADRQAIFAYDYQTNKIPGEPPGATPYWRDVGTIEAYWEANMDMRAVNPALNLYNRQWPLRTNSYPDPPAKFTFDDEDRRGEAIDSVVSGGCILSGDRCRIPSWAAVSKSTPARSIEDSVILDNCDIGRRAKIRRAILDKNVRVAARFNHRLRSRSGPTPLSRHRNRHRGGGRQPVGSSTSAPSLFNCGADFSLPRRLQPRVRTLLESLLIREINPHVPVLFARQNRRPFSVEIPSHLNQLRTGA